LADILSIETSFALFLFSGHYKTLPELRGFPVDFTLLFFVLTLCLMCWAFVSGRMKPSPLSLPMLLMILFGQYATASLFWSSLDPLNIDKGWRFLLLTAPSFFAAHVLAQEPARRERLLRMVAWLSAVLLLYYVYYKHVLGIDMQSTSDMMHARVPEDANTYLEYSAHASILFIIFTALAVFGSVVQLSAAVGGAGAALYLLATIGGRGPLGIALLSIPLLAIGLLLRSSEVLGRMTRLTVVLLSLAGTAAIAYVMIVELEGAGPAVEQFRTLDRYQMQLSNEATDSMDERFEGQGFAFRQWLEKPIFGWGMGEFRVKDSYLKYPHNLLLEILMETGMVGVLIFFPICAAAVRACVRAARDSASGWVDASTGLLFLTDLVSHLSVQGYLADDRIFLAWAGIAVGQRVAGARRPDSSFKTGPPLTSSAAVAPSRPPSGNSSRKLVRAALIRRSRPAPL
jgi:O-antigen ligase